MGAVLIEGSPAPPLYAHAHKATGDVGFPRRCANKVVRKSHSTVPSFLPPCPVPGPGTGQGGKFYSFWRYADLSFDTSVSLLPSISPRGFQNT